MFRRGLAALAAAGAATLAACAGLAELSRLDLPFVEPRAAAELADDRLGRAFDSADKRVEIAQAVWQRIADRYYDPHMNGVDWNAVRTRFRARLAAVASDRQVYRELESLATALGDSHTAVLGPAEAARAHRGAVHGLGLALAPVGVQVAIVDVDPGSPAQRAGLRVGDVVETVDGHELADARAGDAVSARRALRGRGLQWLPAPDEPPDRRWTLRIARGAAGARPIDLVLAPATYTVAPRVDLRREGPVAVLRVSHLHPEAWPRIERALDQASEARALVIDLRGNPGGSFGIFGAFAARLLSDERIVVRKIERAAPGADGQRVTAIAISPTGAGTLARLPLAVLIDARTASAAELLALTLVEQRGALLVGEASCGCAVAVREELPLPLGGVLRVSEVGFTSARGQRIEGVPLQPAVAIEAGLADLREGRDPVLAEAVRRIAPRGAGDL